MRLVAGHRLAGWVRLAVLVIAVAVPGHATTVVFKSFEALCGEADMIFAATVTDVHSRRVAAADGQLETLVTFAEIEPVFGVSAPTVTLRFAGGVLDGVREEFLGVPRFTVGERVVLFARKGYELSPIVGVSQGCFRVVDSDRGARVLTADGKAVTTLGVGGTAGDGGQAASETPMPLAQFLDAVRAELDAQGRR